jgi:PncC family amidohydrolase
VNTKKVEKLIHDYLLESGESLAIAESLTGGLVSSRITDIPGSSNYFLCGVCAYANEAKIKLLKVDPNTIKDHGAVSEECAKEMLLGILDLTGADWGIATTGIAGPTGATETKPLGLVYIAAGNKLRFVCYRFEFSGDRLDVKEKSAQKALEILYDLF